MKSNHYSNHNRCYKGDSRSSGGNVICIASLADDGKKFVNHKALQKAAKLIKKVVQVQLSDRSCPLSPEK